MFKTKIYYQLGINKEEEYLIAVGTNKRMVDIARDSFLATRTDWESEEGEIEVVIERKKPQAPKKEK